MKLDEIEERLRRFLSNAFDGLIFETDARPVGYALYRQTDPDQKEPGGIYLRQFFIARENRRRGCGSSAISLFLNEVVQGRRLVLEVLESNPGGLEFWQSLGMQAYSTMYELVSDTRS